MGADIVSFGSELWMDSTGLTIAWSRRLGLPALQTWLPSSGSLLNNRKRLNRAVRRRSFREFGCARTKHFRQRRESPKYRFRDSKEVFQKRELGQQVRDSTASRGAWWTTEWCYRRYA